MASVCRKWTLAGWRSEGFSNTRIFLVFDVESIGLHGEAFAYGAVLMDTAHWTIERKWERWCSPTLARGTQEDHEWVQKNVDLEYFGSYPLKNPDEVRESFWSLWRGWAGNKVWLAADVLWPVEANFLAACVGHGTHTRKWEGPYPFVDIASVRLAAGFNPLAAEPRLEGELPAHNPLADARQSARLLAEAFQAILKK